MNVYDLLVLLTNLKQSTINDLAELLGPCQASLDLHSALTTVRKMPESK